MELRDFALGVVLAESLEGKLSRPRGRITDNHPGVALRIEQPGRPENLRISPARAVRVPSKMGMVDPRQRVRILHAFANHELQAVELFAWAILAFPDAPGDFREGLKLRTIEEQRHTLLYQARLGELGVRLGEFPVTGYFWSKSSTWTTPLRFICAMGLTFENANLDHTAEYAAAARAAGDERTARLLERVGEDEIGHVRFAVKWLERWKAPGESLWSAYSSSLSWPLRGALARGKDFRAEERRRAGLDEEFIASLARADRGDPLKRPGS